MKHAIPLCLLPLLPLAGPALAQQALPQPQFFADVVLPTALKLGGERFGGLSDLTWDPATGHLLAISDDRVQHGPARFYELALSVDDGTVTGLDILSTHELMSPGGHFGEKGTDPEGIALAADGRLFWSSERDAAGQPAIYVAARDGSAPQAIALPEAYLPDADGTRGIYNNLAFEGLALSPDGTTLIAAIENALVQDGAKASPDAGSPARILMIDSTTLAPSHEYIYPTEAIATPSPVENGWNDNGLTAVLPLPDGRLVTVERSYADGIGFEIRLFTVDLTGATDVNGALTAPADATPVTKTPWFSLRDGDHDLRIDNIEGIAFGPMIDGHQSLILASDNNFNPSQATHVTVFTLDMPQG